MTPLLAGKIAVVTGGSSGIGAATVRALAEAGASVLIGYKSGRDRAEALLASLPAAQHEAVPIAIEDASSIAALEARLRERHGKLHVLVNSAGFTRLIPHRDLDALDDALFDAIMATNVRGTFAVIRALAPLLRAGGDAVIVNVSSVSAFTGLGSNIAYCASKAALDTMTMSLARVLGPEVRVLAVSPAAVATDFVPGRDPAQVEKQAQSTPLRRVVQPEDIASAILACVTHLTTATGTRIIVDGGRHL